MKTLVQEHIKDSNRDCHFIARIIALAVSAAVFAYAFAVLVLDVDVRRLGFRESGGVDYQVCLKPNSYFAQACQPAGKQYVASLIDGLKTKFDYNFEADEPVEYSYSYDVSAKLLATEANDRDKVLYENEEVVLPHQSVAAQTGQGFNLSQEIELDYGKYNNLITAFRADYGLTIEASVTLSLNVQVRAQHPDFSEPLETAQRVALRVPLSERTINVSLQSDQLVNSGRLEEKVRDLWKNLIYVVMAAASGGIFIIVLSWSVMILARREAHRSVYEKALGRILHEYNQLIVEVEHMPHVSRDKVVEVANFDELLNARDTVQQPILHLAINDDCSLFAINDQDTVYAYALSARSLRRGRATTPTSK